MINISRTIFGRQTFSSDDDRTSFTLNDSRFLHSAAHEKEVASLSAQVVEAQRQRDQADSALAQLKVKLKVTEEHRDRLQRELTDTSRALKDGES